MLARSNALEASERSIAMSMVPSESPVWLWFRVVWRHRGDSGGGAVVASFQRRAGGGLASCKILDVTRSSRHAAGSSATSPPPPRPIADGGQLNLHLKCLVCERFFCKQASNRRWRSGGAIW